ncbi:hypothetical protein HaLaN_19024, partial [Haematococcus lacustris]
MNATWRPDMSARKRVIFPSASTCVVTQRAASDVRPCRRPGGINAGGPHDPGAGCKAAVSSIRLLRQHGGLVACSPVQAAWVTTPLPVAPTAA